MKTFLAHGEKHNT